MFNDNETIWLRCRCQNKNDCKRCVGRGYYADPRYLQRFHEKKAMPAQREMTSISKQLYHAKRDSLNRGVSIDTDQIYNDAIMKLTNNKNDFNVIMTVL